MARLAWIGNQRAQESADEAYAKLKPKRKRKKKKPFIRPKYNAYIKSRAWKTRRKQALKDGGWVCAKCGTTDHLEIHHLTYQRLGREKKADLQILCYNCHRSVHPDKQ